MIVECRFKSNTSELLMHLNKLSSSLGLLGFEELFVTVVLAPYSVGLEILSSESKSTELPTDSPETLHLVFHHPWMLQEQIVMLLR